MKTIFYILMAIANISCFAQTTPISTQVTIPVEEFENYLDQHGSIPDGAIINDVNNVFESYTGTWSGNYDSKTLTVVVTEGNVDIDGGINSDILFLRYKIEDSQGNTIISTLNLPDDNVLVCEGFHFGNLNPNGKVYILFYQGEEAECNQKGEMYIYKIPNTNQMELTVIPDRDWVFADCSDGQGEHILPTYNDGVTLTKED